jgi:hypothetical protein
LTGKNSAEIGLQCESPSLHSFRQAMAIKIHRLLKLGKPHLTQIHIADRQRLPIGVLERDRKSGAKPVTPK